MCVSTAKQAVAAGRYQPCFALFGRSVAAGATEEQQQQQDARGSTAEALLNVARQVVPDNIVGAAADMNVLGIITFSLMFGLALSSLGGCGGAGCCIPGCLLLHSVLCVPTVQLADPCLPARYALCRPRS